MVAIAINHSKWLVNWENGGKHVGKSSHLISLFTAISLCNSCHMFISLLPQVQFMASSSDPKGKGPPSKRAGKRPPAEDPDKYSVAQFIEKTEVLAAEDIKVDTDLTHGQVRALSEKNVSDLMVHFEVNEPEEVLLTVVKDRGKTPTSQSPVSLPS